MYRGMFLIINVDTLVSPDQRMCVARFKYRAPINGDVHILGGGGGISIALEVSKLLNLSL